MLSRTNPNPERDKIGGPNSHFFVLDKEIRANKSSMLVNIGWHPWQRVTMCVAMPGMCEDSYCIFGILQLIQLVSVERGRLCFERSLIDV
jgi:hypothetical protein